MFSFRFEMFLFRLFVVILQRAASILLKRETRKGNFDRDKVKTFSFVKQSCYQGTLSVYSISIPSIYRFRSINSAEINLRSTDLLIS